MDARRISLFVLLAFAVATAVLAPAAGAETPEPASAAGAVVEAATATVQSPSPAATESAPEAAAPSPVPAPAPVPPPAPASHPAPSSVSKAAGSAASNVGSTVDRSGAVAETAAATVERVVTSTPSPDLSHASSDLAHTVDTSVRRTTSKSAELVDAAQGKGDEAGPLNHVLDRPLDRVTGAADSLAGTGGSLIETATRPSAASVVPKLDLATEREVLAVNPAVGHELPASSSPAELDAASPAPLGQSPAPVDGAPARFGEGGFAAPILPAGHFALPPLLAGDANEASKLAAGIPPPAIAIDAASDAIDPMPPAKEAGGPSLPTPSTPPFPGAIGSVSAAGGFGSTTLLAAVLALLALATPAIASRLRASAGRYRPAPFICALERPG